MSMLFSSDKDSLPESIKAEIQSLIEQLDTANKRVGKLEYLLKWVLYHHGSDLGKGEREAIKEALNNQTF